jgi:hypothetical protein
MGLNASAINSRQNSDHFEVMILRTPALLFGVSKFCQLLTTETPTQADEWTLEEV